MFRFETLEIWKMAIDYGDKIFDVVDNFPMNIRYNLGSQLRDSSLSISNNIAEGSGSNSTAEFKSFLNYSIRSIFETISGLIFARRRGLISEENFQNCIKTVSYWLKRFIPFERPSDFNHTP